MNEDIIVALIAGACVAVPNLYATAKLNNKHFADTEKSIIIHSKAIEYIDKEQREQNHRLEKLEDKE